MNKSIALCCVLLVSGCSATTQFEAAQTEVLLSVDDGETISLPDNSEHKYSTTSFGQYEFKAEKQGFEPMYGILPLKFNGGYLALDILLFAPAMFFNLREVFPYYQFDLEDKVIRYRKDESDQWSTYRPTDDETSRAKSYCGQ